MKKYKILWLTIAVSTLGLGACNKLDVKPRQSLVVPTTLQDFQGLMDNSDLMNGDNANLGEIASDDYYVIPTLYNSLVTAQDKTVYIWSANPFAGVQGEGDWQFSYQKVLNCNIVLNGLRSIKPNAANQAEYNNVMGQALFHRAFNFFMVAEDYTKPYVEASAGSDLGIVLKLTSDINDKSVRSTLKQTYDQIFSDLSAAKSLLPNQAVYKSRPSKAATFALLARIHLAKGDYQDAYANADSCLKLYNTLLDYNNLNPKSSLPIPLLNDEVLFQASHYSSQILFASRASVDTILFKSYENNDLRKSIFFTANTNGTYGFKGSYSNSSRILFGGLACDEIYLVRAECLARAGNVQGALADLNTMLKNRYQAGTFVAVSASSADDALSKILLERRKELVFRGTRWSDLRRLNQDPRFAITLTRNLAGTIYTLPANDKRYTFPIPDFIIKLSGIQQNP